MCKPIISAGPAPRKPFPDLILDDDPPPLLPDCPRCFWPLRYDATPARVICPACGWSVALAADEAADLADALAGITDLPVGAFLALLAVSNAALAA